MPCSYMPQSITRSDFKMVYAMYGRNVEDSLASRVFDLFDANKAFVFFNVSHDLK